VIACATEANPPVDLVNVDAASPQETIDLALSVCASCPVLAECARRVKRMNVAGVAGGLTEEQRRAWQERNGVRLEDEGDGWWSTFVVAVTPARQLTKAMLDNVPLRTPAGDLHPVAAGLIERMTAAGMSAEQISDLLSPEQGATDTVSALLGVVPDGVADRTVNYTRRKRKEHARVES